jgi:hypothetical protein
MPLIKSHTDEAREQNIKEMIAAGHPIEQAVAAGYATQRKYKKMHAGGMAEDADEFRDINEINADGEPYTMEPPNLSEEDMMLAKKLKNKYEDEEEDEY